MGVQNLARRLLYTRNDEGRIQTMFTFSFWQRWLLIVALAVTIFGIVMTFVSGTPLFELFNRQIDPA